MRRPLMWRDARDLILRPPLLALAAALLASGVITAFSAVRAPLPVTQVESVAMTVSDMDRAVDFYTRVLSFEKLADHEVAGGSYERLWGLFGVRVRSVRLRLGEE